jgi:drug/metabolite transporter (DMT)-like permease
MQRGSGVVAVTASAVLFGTLALFGKYAQDQHLSVVTLLSWRFLIAAIVLCTIVYFRHELHWPGIRHAAQLIALGVLFVGQSAAYFISLRSSPAAVTSVLLYTYPVIVTVFGWLVFNERATARGAAALALATFGVCLVVGVSVDTQLAASGVLWGVASGFLYASYILVGNRVLRDLKPFFSMAAVSSTAAVCFLTYGAMTHSLNQLGAVGWLTVSASALLPTVVGASLFLYGLAKVGPARASILSTIEPVATATLAAILLAERLSWTRAIGGGAILAAAALTTGVPITKAVPALADH